MNTNPYKISTLMEATPLNLISAEEPQSFRRSLLTPLECEIYAFMEGIRGNIDENAGDIADNIFSYSEKLIRDHWKGGV
jgi:hypothetical protein|tara:strand:+ start:114 stop:350 length:237 start_codon:yes stop_codon:yes gene_type:complete